LSVLEVFKEKNKVVSKDIMGFLPLCLTRHQALDLLRRRYVTMILRRQKIEN